MTKLPHMLHVRKFCHFEGAGFPPFLLGAQCTCKPGAPSSPTIKGISERLFFFLKFPV